MKQKLIIAVLGLVIGAAVGYSFCSNSDVEKETAKENKDVTTVIEERTNKDGTVSKVTKIVDRTKTSKETEKTTIVLKPQYEVGVIYGQDLARGLPVYGAIATRRVFGNFKGGVLVMSTGTGNTTVGGVVSYEF